MKIGLDGRSLAAKGLRGWDRYTIALIKELEAQGVEIVLFLDPKHPIRPEHIAGLNSELVSFSAPSGILWEQLLLPWHIWRSGCDAYHAPCERGVPIFAHCPRFLTIHSVTFHSYFFMIEQGILSPPISKYIGKEFDPKSPSWSDRYILSQFRSATHIFVPSKFTKEEVVQFLGISPRKITPTPLAIAPEFSQNTTSEESAKRILDKLAIQKPYILYVSGFEAHKNIDGLLDAFLGIRKLSPDMNFVLVGSKGVPSNVLDKIKALGLDPNSNCRCFSDLGNELVAIYDNAKCYVNLSWRESFGLPALEASSRGLPAVISQYGASLELFADNQYLVDPSNTDSVVATTLKAIAEDTPERRKQRRAFAKGFSWEKLTKTTIETYKKFLF